jgi:predicted metal-dependent HD superfamily phosphohydrolase
MTEPARLCQSVRMDALRGRWRAECTAVAPTADTAAVDAVGTDLLQRWREPHRHYHDVTHLGEVLTAVDALCAAEGVDRADHAAASLAAWFHDAVYAVESPDDNEAESAALAAAALPRLGVAQELSARVAALVLATATHDLGEAGAADPDPARVVIHDADLWVLSAPLARFDEYCRQVREEYAHVPSTAYARGRSQVLRPFLVRPHVYQSSHAREAWEPAARENLARELTRLAG